MTAICNTILTIFAVAVAVAAVLAIAFIALVCHTFKDMPDDMPWWEDY